MEAIYQIAQEIVKEHFPNCMAAILAGSIVRGEGTPTSDLDLVVIDPAVPDAYRYSFYYNGRPVELFVHNLTSYKKFFDADCERGRPSLPQMVAEGVVMVDRGVCQPDQARSGKAAHRRA